MSQTRLLALVIAAIAALAGGWYFGGTGQPPARAGIDAGQLMFPDLAPKLKDARAVEITTKGKVTRITLKDGVWGLADKGNYKVIESKLRGLFTALTETRLMEPRTTDPVEFPRLGLEDPLTIKDGTATLLRILDGADQPIATLIAGHRRTRTQGNVPEQIYLRKPGDNQTWLAEGGLQPDADPQVWLDRDVINIAKSQIMKVASTRDGQTIELWQDGATLKVTRPDETPPLETYKLDDVARALEALTFLDVKPATEPLGELAGSSVFTTLDGLEIHVTVHHLDKDSWTLINVVAPDRNKPEAERLNTKLGPWAFQTGMWKDKALIPSLDDLKAPPPKPDPKKP